MKYVLYFIIGIALLSSCKKEENTTIEAKNSMADDLKNVIAQEQVQALQYCCVGCGCSQTIGWGTDYSFPGDNFVRIKDMTYNLNLLQYYKIETIGSEKRLVLYFP